jgi:hypothetical protein
VHAIEVPLQHIALAGAYIQQALILIQVDGNWWFGVSKYLDLPPFVHVDYSCLAVLAGEADVFFLEGEDVLDGREVLYLLHEGCFEVVPDGHLPVLQRHHQKTFSEEAQRADCLRVGSQLFLPGDRIAIGNFIQGHVFLHSSHCHYALVVAKLNCIDPAFLAGTHDDLDAREIVYD